MHLPTDNRNYETFQTVKASKEVNVYLARDLLYKATPDVESPLYLVNEITDVDLIHNNIEQLLALRQERRITDFVDVFTLQSKLYLVFKHKKPYLLADYLTRHKLTYANRVKLLENVLFNISSHALFPDSILCALTEVDNIHVNPDESSFSSYALQASHLLPNSNRRDVWLGIARLIMQMFPEELMQKRGRTLHFIIEKCERSVYRSLPEIIHDVRLIDTATTWERFKRSLQERKQQLSLVKQFGWGVIIVLIVFVIYTRFISPNAAHNLDKQLPVKQVGEIIVIEATPSDDSEPTTSSYPLPPPVITIDSQ